MSAPNDRKYTETHEWIKMEGGVATIGITRYAADELTDVTYVELPELGAEVEAGSPFGEIESVKATSDLSSPIGGKVIDVNGRLDAEPELVNQDPFGEGWMVKLEAGDTAPMETLMDVETYEGQTSPQ